jgi:hypothetical protein
MPTSLYIHAQILSEDRKQSLVYNNFLSRCETNVWASLRCILRTSIVHDAYDRTTSVDIRCEFPDYISQIFTKTYLWLESANKYIDFESDKLQLYKHIELIILNYKFKRSTSSKANPKSRIKIFKSKKLIWLMIFELVIQLLTPNLVSWTSSGVNHLRVNLILQALFLMVALFVTIPTVNRSTVSTRNTTVTSPFLWKVLDCCRAIYGLHKYRKLNWGRLE